MWNQTDKLVDKNMNQAGNNATEGTGAGAGTGTVTPGHK